MQIHRSDHDGGVRLLRLERPPANAINTEFLQSLHDEAVAADEDDSVRALILTGTGRFFSAGLDLKEMARGGAQALGSLGGGKDGIYRLWRVGKPTLAMIGGHALAGGAILMFACDFRIAARGPFKLGVTETGLGLPLPNGAFQIARYALRGRDVRRILLEADAYTPEAACAMGLVDEVVEPDEFEVRCLAFAGKLGSHPSAAYGYQKYKLQAEANQWIHAPVEAGTERFRAALADPATFTRLLAARGEGRPVEASAGGRAAGSTRNG